MTNHAKAKGNSWERDLAKLLSKVFGYHFERNKNGSGAFVGGINAKRKEYLSDTQKLSFMADILPPDEMQKMCVEAKFYKDFPFHHFLINKEIPDVKSWIKQQLDVVEEQTFWFIAFKINHAGSYIIIPESLCKEFIDDRLGNRSIYFHNDLRYIVADLETFITTYKDDIIKKCA
jgi:hypothetical protein